jgi:hypothetical protein
MILVKAKDTLALFDVAIVDLAWGLLAAALIGVVGGLVYAALTNPPPDTGPEDVSEDEPASEST